MARLYQGAGAEDTTSQAERDLLERFEKLPDDYVAIHSVKWITHNAREHGSVGEADFVVAHPQHGVLILEVKGGEIRVTRNEWVSRDRFGTDHAIKDPFAQADRSKYPLMDWLKHDSRTRHYTYPVFTAVAFPDVGLYSDIRPDCPKDIVIDATRLNGLERALEEIFAYWQRRFPHLTMSGLAAVSALVELLVPTRVLQARVAEIFERERQKIEELTQQQYAILKMLRRYRRAAIVGGAGTGKTMLAMEKAQQLADAGFRVLFVCFNRNLAEWLSKHLASERILTMTYHSLVGTAINWARLPGLSRMDMDAFSEKAPDLLLDAAGILRSADSGVQDKLFDAIIVDEAQDFEDTWRIPLPELLKDSLEGIFYVFFDDNQRLYAQITNIPMEQEPLYLVENCRNTQEIYAALTPYAQADQETECHCPEGRPVEQIPVADADEARAALQRVLHRLVREEGLSADDIVLLTPSSEKRSQWKSDEMVGRFILTWNMDTEMKDAIRVCTIYRFKGLESAVVILTEMDQVREEISDQLAYVGLSRARNHVVVIGELPASGGVGPAAS
jgi:hypothetical protein